MCDGRTDGQTDRIAMADSMKAVAALARKNTAHANSKQPRF